MTDIDGRPGRGPAKTPRAREAEYLRGNLIKECGPGKFIQDRAATSGLKAEYKVTKLIFNSLPYKYFVVSRR